MYHIGVDVIEIVRIQEAVERWGDRFLRRIYTQEELHVCRNRAPALAVRFAAKEAVMKALGTGTKDIDWRDIEVLSNSDGKPQVCLHGRAQKRGKALGLGQLAISLSHSREFAVASVMGEAC